MFVWFELLLFDEELLAVDDVEAFEAVNQCLTGCHSHAAHLAGDGRDVYHAVDRRADEDTAGDEADFDAVIEAVGKHVVD